MYKLKKLTKAQKNKLKDHSNHHTKKHMASMRMNMMRGKSFKESHEIAKKKLGNNFTFLFFTYLVKMI